MKEYNSSHDHVGDDLLDAYAFGDLDDTQIETIEEHLLVCSDCQDRLERLDLLRQALRQLHDDPKQSQS